MDRRVHDAVSGTAPERVQEQIAEAEAGLADARMGCNGTGLTPTRASRYTETVTTRRNRKEG